LSVSLQGIVAEFEVLGLPFDESYHEIQDTIWLPPAIGGVPSSVTIRMRIKQFLGKDVFHCHILTHEDQGMMTNFLVSPTGDPSAEGIDFRDQRRSLRD